ncbi:MAG: hypothetical protein ACFFE6_02515 [Candidatus Thorarchaeota archaeon]
MKSKWIRIAAGLSMMVLCISVYTNTSQAAEVWREEFDSGLTGWTTFAFESWQSGPVVEGNFSTADDMLTVLDDDVNFARHDSANVVGTWSFDMYIPDTPNGWIGVAFMSNGTRPLELDTRMIAIEATTDGTDRFVIWWLRGANNGVADTVYTPGGSIVGWHHIDVTRTSGGSFNVFFNGTFEYTTLTNDVTQSTYLECFASNATGAAFDNIIVSDTIDVTTPTLTPTAPPILWELVMIGGGVAIVVILLIIIVLKRR